MKLRKNHLISPKNFAIPSEETQKYPPKIFGNSSGEIEMNSLRSYYYIMRQPCRWNRTVPLLELFSSKRGTVFGTRIYYKYSTIRIRVKKGD